MASFHVAAGPSSTTPKNTYLAALHSQRSATRANRVTRIQHGRNLISESYSSRRLFSARLFYFRVKKILLRSLRLWLRLLRSRPRICVPEPGPAHWSFCQCAPWELLWRGLTSRWCQVCSSIYFDGLWEPRFVLMTYSNKRATTKLPFSDGTLNRRNDITVPSRAISLPPNEHIDGLKVPK